MAFRVALFLFLAFVSGCDVSLPFASPEPTPTSEPDHDSQILAATWQLVFLDLTDLILVDSNGARRDVASFQGLPLAAATAFAVSEDTLVTNAHVVQGILDVEHAASFPSLIAVQHETGRTVRIIDAWMHPSYDPDAPIQNIIDLGILRTDGTFVDTLPIQPDTEALSLEVGDAVTLCGFPGGVTENNTFDGFIGNIRPRATCGNGEITELRLIDESAPPDPENLTSLRYDIATERGSSGSAVVGSEGLVIGVHAFAFFELGTGGGPRSDTLHTMLDLVDTEAVSPVDIETVRVVVVCVEEGEASLCPEEGSECFFDPDTGRGAGFDPNCFDCDSDCDGWSDRTEFENGSNPCDDRDIPLLLEITTGECTATAVRGTSSELEELLAEFDRQIRRRDGISVSVWDGVDLQPLTPAIN